MTSASGSQRATVAVLFGGRSGEHEVSVASARGVLANLGQGRYNILRIGITKDGRWVILDEAEMAASQVTGGRPVILPPDHGRGVLLVADAGGNWTEQTVNVVLPILHGPFGEDGTVQGLLELTGLPYAGAGVLGSSVGMDKAVMKTLFRAAGLPVTDWTVIRRDQWLADPASADRQVLEAVGYPCFVKPANMGSSVGISRVDSPAELPAAMDLAAGYDLKILVECSVPAAREIECAVLGNDAPEASVLGEVIPSREFYSYEAKYVDDSSALIIPAELPGDQSDLIRDMAVRAFQAVDCAGMGRVDFLLSAETQEVYLNEINTLPGFTTISMYPKLWQASGLTYPALLDRLIELALERHQERQSLRASYT